MNDHEQKWIEQALHGDISAFRQLVEQHQQKIYQLAFDLTGNHHTAEDLSQEAFIKAFHALKNFRAQASFSSWLYRITVNLFIDKNRNKSATMLEFRENIENEHTPNIVASPFKQPDHETEIHDLQNHITQALEKLTPSQRTIFTLRHHHHQKIKEIADTLNVTEGTVKTQLFRAIKTLQTQLAFYRPNMGEE